MILRESSNAIAEVEPHGNWKNRLEEVVVSESHS